MALIVGVVDTKEADESDPATVFKTLTYVHWDICIPVYKLVMVKLPCCLVVGGVSIGPREKDTLEELILLLTILVTVTRIKLEPNEAYEHVIPD